MIEILNHWVYISKKDGTTGWVVKQSFIEETPSKKEEPKKEETPTSKEEETKKINKTGYVSSDGINFREEPNTDSKVLKTFLQNAQVTILEEQGEWYKVTYKEQTGYILKMYVSSKKIDTTISSRSGGERKLESPERQLKEENNTKVESSKGKEVVSLAKKYLGSRYVYGGATPSKGFDCSGFTMYIYKQFGINLSHSATAQSKVGTKVEKSNLQLGDLVFFSDYKTYTGIGHCGIYIGDGKFIHASTETTGVITSSLFSGSYVKRYVTATRVI